MQDVLGHEVEAQGLRRRDGKYRISITRWTRGVAAAVMLPLVTIWVAQGMSEHNDRIDDAQARTDEVASVVASGLDQYLAVVTNLTASIVASLDLQHPSSCLELQSVVNLERRIHNLVVTRADGSFGCSAVESPEVSASSLQRPWVQAAISSGEQQWSPPFMGSVSNEWVVDLVTPLKDGDGQVWGALKTAIPIEGIQDHVEALAEPGVLTTVTTLDATVIARTAPSGPQVSERLPGAVPTEVSLTWYESGSGYRETQGADGIQRLFFYKAVSGPPWIIYAGVPSDVIYAPLRARLAREIGLLLAVLLFVILLTRRIEIGIVASLASIGRELELAVSGGGEVDLSDNAPLEVAAFVREFNLMVQQRSVALEEAAAKRELERSNRLKSRFLSLISHELRTPLNAVLGMSEALTEEVYGSLTQEQLESIGLVHESGQHLLHLIDDILEFTRLEADHLGQDPEWIDVELLCGASIRAVSSRTTRKRVAIVSRIDATASRICMNEKSLINVLAHVLGNAIDVTGAGGEVGFTVSEDRGSGMIHFDVEDNGVSCAGPGSGDVFVSVGEIDSDQPPEAPGMGLGLIVIRGVVELHGGSLLVKSRSGEGKTVRVALPARAAEDSSV